MQKRMLFPAYMAPVVDTTWQPTAGDLQEQAMIAGQCGKLHVASWRLKQSRGTVMIFHGNGESMVSVQIQAQKFLDLGYSVMGWDYPGYGKSDDCWFSEHDLLKDTETSYQWLLKHESDSRIVFYGRSMGSGLALYIASKHPGHRVLLVSPYDSLLSVAKDNEPFIMPVGLLMRYPLSAVQWIGKVRGDIHAIHGTADALIKPEHAIALMKAAKGNADIEWIKGAGHIDITKFEQSNRWLTKQLTGSGQGN
ncbi:MAG TPA: alpha/beta fold hydrolase [Methylophilaceae bacterium]|jgi:hypothetical protein